MVALRRNVRVSSKVEGAFRIDSLEVSRRPCARRWPTLMHRDYSPDGCASQVQVTMCGDRIEILSQAVCAEAMTVDRLGELGVSFPRNQALANILRATPYAEGLPRWAAWRTRARVTSRFGPACARRICRNR